MLRFRARLITILATASLLAAWTILPGEPASASVPGLRIFYGQSGFDSVDVKSARAYCPVGERVLGGGGMSLRQQGNQRPGLALVWLKPVHPTDGSRDYFYVYAAEFGVSAADSWEVLAQAVCAPDPGRRLDPVIIESRSPASSDGVRTAQARCPTGKRVVGTGATINHVNGQIALQMSRTSSTGDISRAQAHEDFNGYSPSWDVSSWAVCAYPPAGYEVATRFSVQGGSESSKNASAICPGTKRSLSAGAALSNQAPGEVALSDVILASDLRSAGGIAWEHSPTAQNWSYMLGQAICVNP